MGIETENACVLHGVLGLYKATKVAKDAVPGLNDMVKDADV